MCQFLITRAMLLTIFQKSNRKSNRIMAKEVTKRSENYSQWYNDLVVKADLADLGEDAAYP